MGRTADVVATVQRIQNPDEGRRMRAASFAELGMSEARSRAREVMRVHPEFTITRCRPPYRDEAILDRNIESLRKAARMISRNYRCGEMLSARSCRYMKAGQ
jgi:hypothetical protein